MLSDSSHRVSIPIAYYRSLTGRLTFLKCIMITGDNPLTAVHVANDVEIVDRDVLILDVKENEPNSGAFG